MTPCRLCARYPRIFTLSTPRQIRRELIQQPLPLAHVKILASRMNFKIAANPAFHGLYILIRLVNFGMVKVGPPVGIVQCPPEFTKVFMINRNSPVAEQRVANVVLCSNMTGARVAQTILRRVHPMCAKAATRPKNHRKSKIVELKLR